MSCSIDNYAHDFNVSLHKLINLMESIIRDESKSLLLNRLNKRLKMAVGIMGPRILISSTAPIIIEYSDVILHSNGSNLYNNLKNIDIKSKITNINSNNKQEKDDREFALLLFDSIEKYCETASTYIMNQIHAELVVILQCCLNYQITTLS